MRIASTILIMENEYTLLGTLSLAAYELFLDGEQLIAIVEMGRIIKVFAAIVFLGHLCF
jgi:hypothetical protein